MIRQPEFFQTMGIAGNSNGEIGKNKRLTKPGERCKITPIKAKASLSLIELKGVFVFFCMRRGKSSLYKSV